MRSPVYIALAYIAGVHGFAFFAPYLLVFAAAVHLIRTHQARKLAYATVAGN